MLFNSLPFIAFFIAVFIVFFTLPAKWRWVVLLAASCYFYMAFIPVYILILAAIILINYYAAIKIEQAKNVKEKNLYFLISLWTIIGVLLFFKYFNFINDNLTELLSITQISNPIPFVKIILPLGISFSTFQSLSYLIDVKNGKIKAEQHLGIYALFIMFFPHISAGPIARGGHLLPQLRNAKGFNIDDFKIGFSQVMLGFFKKAVVGDMLGNYVDTFYRSYEMHSGFATLFTCWIFLFQLYADFSGYSDIAIGLSRMLGIKLNINFALPLFSKTMTELWRRWHISLSTWLRDYLFTPLSIARRDWGKAAVVYSQVVTFAVCGIWHGAGWNFLIYGIIHGIYLASEYLLKIKSSFFNKNFLRKCLGIFITFNLLSLALIFFRSPDLAKAIDMFSSFFSNPLSLNVKIYDTSFFITMLFMLGILMAVDYIFFRNDDMESLYFKKPKTLFLLNIGFFLLILLFGVSSNTQFIYFQF